MLLAKRLESFAHQFARWTGSAYGFSIALLTVLVWLAVGYLINFTARWGELFTIYINIVTFLMIFLIQRSQNKETAALHIKLNELINATQKADNTLINVEERTEKEISEVQGVHRKIAKYTNEKQDI